MRPPTSAMGEGGGLRCSRLSMSSQKLPDNVCSPSQGLALPLCPSPFPSLLYPPLTHPQREPPLSLQDLGTTPPAWRQGGRPEPSAGWNHCERRRRSTYLKLGEGLTVVKWSHMPGHGLCYDAHWLTSLSHTEIKIIIPIFQQVNQSSRLDSITPIVQIRKQTQIG